MRSFYLVIWVRIGFDVGRRMVICKPWLVGWPRKNPIELLIVDNIVNFVSRKAAQVASALAPAPAMALAA